MKYFQKRERKEEENLDKAFLAYEHSRARDFYNQWLIESRRSQEHRTRTSSRNSQTQGGGTKNQPRQDDQPCDNRPQEVQSRGTQEQDSQAWGSQIPDHPRRTSIVSNNSPGDSQPGHNQTGLLRESERSTPSRNSPTLPDLQALEKRARERRILEQMSSVKEPEDVVIVRRIEFITREEGKGKEKMVEDLEEVGEAEQTSKRDKSKGGEKAVNYDEPMRRRLKKAASF
ncbi:hypothetical protein NCS57_01162000 [Fusarium keratoplasticum]|uniref:Uncharacterized protein n=1 Tax=Fusarium keratoplasticum TaxID=1328300 RepID=A0ACC0QL44_9HYPO|nr:hypothetical protein NCS57_01162000 [Fusarium keratoplasticum]KAI8657827.1 hypothetical protein NCS57_01162000 [Fusarium keratoplasticum]